MRGGAEEAARPDGAGGEALCLKCQRCLSVVAGVRGRRERLMGAGGRGVGGEGAGMGRVCPSVPGFETFLSSWLASVK